MTEIEEERTVLNPDELGKGLWSQDPNQFDERAQSFWEDMFSLVNLLNFNNSRYTINTVESPILTNYLLWRLLNEIKLLNINTRITSN